MAAATDGTLYEVGGGTLSALTPAGVVRWQYPSFANAVAVGMSGTIYSADGTSGVGAYAPDGRRLWGRATGDEVVRLAERADGSVLALGSMGISAIDRTGHRLWRRPFGYIVRTPVARPPSIAVDAAGHAYIGRSDGKVYAIGADGSLLWTLPAGGPSVLGDTPAISLGPGGTLVIVRTDGRLSVYQ